MTKQKKLLRATSVLVLAGGFALLVTGDITAAPLLLVVAYVVLIPFTMLRA